MRLDKLKVLIYTLLFLSGVFLVIYGRIIPGWTGLFVMLVGVTILFGLLYMYNRRYK